MPLSVLLPLVVVGITLIVVLVRLLAPTPPCRFATPDEAIAVWDRRHPDLPASAARLADDGAAALVETAGGAGLVWTLGADPVTRLAHGFTAREAADGLRLALHDFTAPNVRVHLADAADRAHWMTRLTGAPT